MNYWNKIDLSTIDTPALIVDKDMVTYNIEQAISYAQGTEYFRPHVKTHKMLEVAKMQKAAGIDKFKCATIPEAEMLGMAEAPDVLIAYALQGPKIDRLIQLIQKYPKTKYASLVDDVSNAKLLNDKMARAGIKASVFIDVNNGNDRTGTDPKGAKVLLISLMQMSQLEIAGMHCYDGHLRMSSLDERERKIQKAFKQVIKLKEHYEKKLDRSIILVAGGSPAFSTHSRFHDVQSSPGTWIFWDERYGRDYKELPFNKAAVLATRVISQIDKHRYCLDLGHKSVASEFPFPRIRFTNDLECEQVSQSEEHLVIKCKDKNKLKVGELLTAFPYHICPTVALYDTVQVVENGAVSEEWEVIARNRKITV